METQLLKETHLSDFPAVDDVGLRREVVQVVIEDAAQGREVQQVDLLDGGLWCRLSSCFLFDKVLQWEYKKKKSNIFFVLLF